MDFDISLFLAKTKSKFAPITSEVESTESKSSFMITLATLESGFHCSSVGEASSEWRAATGCLFCK